MTITVGKAELAQSKTHQEIRALLDIFLGLIGRIDDMADPNTPALSGTELARYIYVDLNRSIITPDRQLIVGDRS